MNPSKANQGSCFTTLQCRDGRCIWRDGLNRGRRGDEATGQVEGSRGTIRLLPLLTLSDRRNEDSLGNLARQMTGLMLDRQTVPHEAQPSGGRMMRSRLPEVFKRDGIVAGVQRGRCGTPTARMGSAVCDRREGKDLSRQRLFKLSVQ